MDFSLTEDQRALSELAAQILSDACTLERLKSVERSEAGYDRELWLKLARAGLLGAALPEDAGGTGGGFIEACLLLEQQGRRVAMLPLLSTIVSGALPLIRFGSAAQRRRYLPEVVTGTCLLSAALCEPSSDSRSPQCVAEPDGSGWRLSGPKIMVPLAREASAVLVPARTRDGAVGVFLVDPRAAGVTLRREETMSWEAVFRMELDAAPTGADGALGPITANGEVLQWIIDRTTVGLCALAAGACREALRITAEYASSRKQFDKPIAMFQAVGQRMADCYIDNEAVHLTMWQAASRLAEEMPSDKEVATAKYWAAEGGSRIGHAALHIHGGISIDVDYPIHRYFLWLKQIEYTMGAATPQLVRLGAAIAEEP